MTPPLYTDNDLHAEAALCLSALSTSPTLADILRWLPGAYVESHREDDRSGHTWGDLLDNTGLAEVARKVHGLIEQAGNAVGALEAARWLINLGADGLQPDERAVTIDGPNGPIVRIHFAFEPGMDDDLRAALVEGVGQAIDAGQPDGDPR